MKIRIPARINQKTFILILTGLLCFSGCSKKASGSFKSHMETGRIYAKIKKYSEAIREYKSALLLRPESAEILFLIGQAFRNTNDFTEAQEYLEKCLELMHKVMGLKKV
ncbi:tetratricopeptide repeat protein, partial [PVC group bacterium]|nr:tetratricopeptide repeat protein [PVC group bacterium]